MSMLDDLNARILQRQLEYLYESQKKKTGQPLMGKASDIAALKDELSRHKLAIEALTQLLLDKGVIDQAELDDTIEKVDARDGVIDGKCSDRIPPSPQKPVIDEPPPQKKLVIPKSPGDQDDLD